MSITTENGLVMETAEEFAKFLENWRAAIDADLDRAKPPNQRNLRRKLVGFRQKIVADVGVTVTVTVAPPPATT